MTVNIHPPFVVSAPGKVILFGEHAVVYNKSAIAAAVSLRTYMMVVPNSEPGHDRTIRLQFPDIKLDFECPVDDLPWDLVEASKKAASLLEAHSGSNGSANGISVLTPPTSAEPKPATTKNGLESAELEIDEEIVTALQPIIARVNDTFQHAALLAFFYLYVNICTRETPGYTFVTKSTLPVGAGLGSSATFSVCLSTSFLTLQGSLSDPTFGSSGTNGEASFSTPPLTPTTPVNDKVNSSTTNDTSSSSAMSTTNLGNPDHDIINKWAYIGEKCLHGNPSGIDNTVACRGGAVLFQRPSTLIPMRKFPELPLILTNTKQPRRTKDLVGRVRDLYDTFRQGTDSILDSIEHVTQEAFLLLGSAEHTQSSKDGSNAVKLAVPTISQSDESLKRLLHLVRINHGLLVSLGVSHPKLEKVKSLGDELNIGETKLTGAGGGGCAITLLHVDEDKSQSSDNRAVHERFHEFRQRLESEKNGFEIFETVLGGPGVGFVTNVPSLSCESFLNMERKTVESLPWKYWG